MHEILFHVHVNLNVVKVIKLFEKLLQKMFYIKCNFSKWITIIIIILNEQLYMYIIAELFFQYNIKLSNTCTSIKCGFQTTDGAPEQFVL